jgi:predicted RNA-binding protein with TRAM domain
VAKTAKSLVGLSVVFALTPELAKAINDKRNPERPPVEQGQRVAMKITEDHGGDCASGVLSVDGFHQDVTRVNRGPSIGQWDWRTRTVIETDDPTP